MNPTPTISEAARRAAEQEIDEFEYRRRITQPRRPFEAGHYVQQALASAHPAPKEGQPTDELTWEYWRDRARESELRLSEAKREVEALKKRILDDNKAYGCELRDPNGTIWEYANALRSHLKTANELLREAHAMFLPPESDFGHTPPKAALLSRIRTHLNQQSK